jgi:hypothetical protein
VNVLSDPRYVLKSRGVLQNLGTAINALETLYTMLDKDVEYASTIKERIGLDSSVIEEISRKLVSIADSFDPMIFSRK